MESANLIKYALLSTILSFVPFSIVPMEKVEKPEAKNSLQLEPGQTIDLAEIDLFTHASLAEAIAQAKTEGQGQLGICAFYVADGAGDHAASYCSSEWYDQWCQRKGENFVDPLSRQISRLVYYTIDVATLTCERDNYATFAQNFALANQYLSSDRALLAERIRTFLLTDKTLCKFLGGQLRLECHDPGLPFWITEATPPDIQFKHACSLFDTEANKTPAHRDEDRFVRARTLLTRALASGELAPKQVADAYSRLSSMYFYGLGGPKNFEQVRRMSSWIIDHQTIGNPNCTEEIQKPAEAEAFCEWIVRNLPPDTKLYQDAADKLIDSRFFKQWVRADFDIAKTICAKCINDPDTPKSRQNNARYALARICIVHRKYTQARELFGWLADNGEPKMKIKARYQLVKTADYGGQDTDPARTREICNALANNLEELSKKHQMRIVGALINLNYQKGGDQRIARNWCNWFVDNPAHRPNRRLETDGPCSRTRLFYIAEHMNYFGEGGEPDYQRARAIHDCYEPKFLICDECASAYWMTARMCYYGLGGDPDYHAAACACHQLLDLKASATIGQIADAHIIWIKIWIQQLGCIFDKQNYEEAKAACTWLTEDAAQLSAEQRKELEEIKAKLTELSRPKIVNFVYSLARNGMRFFGR